MFVELIPNPRLFAAEALQERWDQVGQALQSPALGQEAAKNPH
jgi:hypothetical protein